MAKQKKNRYEGVVYSTDPSFEYEEDLREEETLAPRQQQLKVQLDRKQRAGKVVTLVYGFIGKEEDLIALGKLLKQRCGTGGTAKGGEIVIQGDVKQKVLEILEKEGYRAKGVGG